MAPRLSATHPMSSCSDSFSLGGGGVQVVSAQSPKQPQQQKVRCHSDSALMPKCHSSSSFQLLSNSSKPRRRISFDERVSVREFESGSWGSVTDLQQFFPPHQQQCGLPQVPQIILCHKDSNTNYNSSLRKTTTSPEFYSSSGNIFRNAPTAATSSSHSYVSCLPHHEDHHDMIDDDATLLLQPLLRREIRTVLMVDPHDIFLSIFTKRLQQSLPHVTIMTAHSADEALRLCQSHNFDMIMTEERLSLFHRHGDADKPTSGSSLLKHFQLYCPRQFQNGLLIGVSAHWQLDHTIMEQSGADYCWKKAPTPNLSPSVLEELLHTLLHKRGKHDLAKALLASSNHAEDRLSSSPQLASSSRKQ